MKCRFQVGDKVVCVDAKNTKHPRILPYTPEEKLVEGEIYTVSGMMPWRHAINGERIILLLEEKPRESGGIPGYFYGRFRPAEDIEQFRRLCINLPADMELVE